jgi:hypothetical protein
MRQFLLNDQFDADTNYRVCIGIINLFATREVENPLPKQPKGEEKQQKLLLVNIEQEQL